MVKLAFRNGGETETSSDKGKLRELIFNTPTPKESLQNCLNGAEIRNSRISENGKSTERAKI